MKKILFVDDEPNVLGGLRRMLRPQQAEWATEFAEGGPQALAVLEREPFDIIVSDMRMPGMTGAQLLEQVGLRFPRMVRILLTGQCDAESGLRALRVAHQMLSKPCDAESLRATIARTGSLSELLPKEALQIVVTRQTSIPSAPALYRRLLDEINAAAPSLDRVGAIVSKDLGMVTKILHVVNSSFFGPRCEITDPRQAVSLLGLETMRLLILTPDLFCTAQGEGLSHAGLKLLPLHSRTTSVLARGIASFEEADERVVEYAALAGLLHDVGKLILLDRSPREYAGVLDRALQSHEPLWRIEREVYGASHAEVGACLLDLWGLPRAVVDAVAWHHRPAECPTPPSTALTAVHVANVLASQGFAGGEKVDLAYLERLNLLARLPTWSALAQKPRVESWDL